METNSYEEAIRGYRVLLFGSSQKGSKGTESVISAEAAREVIRKGGKLPLSALLRLRVRYFTDGAVLGSSEYVQNFFVSHYHEEGDRRKDGPRRMSSCEDWGGLMCLRNIKKDPVQ